MTPLDLARQGIFLFPVNGKQPLVKWRDTSTTEEAQIVRWMNDIPGCGFGIDCGRSGLLVVDDDRGKNPHAEPSLAALPDLPVTFTVMTVSGGYHYYFRGAGRNSAGNVLGAGLDTRGEGGFVVAPCSPGYAVVEDAPIADAPAWLLERLASPAPAATPQPTQAPVPLDRPENIGRAVAYLQRAAPAVEGYGGDAHTYAVCAQVKDFGISERLALELLLEHWDDRNLPPWGDDLANKIRNAYRYGQNAVGAASATFEAFEDPEAPKTPTKMFRRGTEFMNETIVIDWLAQGLIETPSTGLVFGDPSAGKTFVALDLALSVACGGEWFGAFTRQGIVVYFAGEGRAGMRRRMRAWAKHRGAVVPPDNLWVTGTRVEFTPKAIRAAVAELKEIQAAAGAPIAMIVVDTLARHIPAGSDENSAKDAGQFINTCDSLRDQFSCTVAIVHHSGKMSKDASRGSSAIRGAMDWEIKVDNGKKGRSLTFTKMKEAETPRPRGFTLEQVDLGEGLSSAVPVECEFQNDSADNLGVDASTALTVLRMLSSEGGGKGITRDAWRKSFVEQLGPGVPRSTISTKFTKGEKILFDRGIIKIDGPFIWVNAE